jgi:hypothetical protein
MQPHQDTYETHLLDFISTPVHIAGNLLDRVTSSNPLGLSGRLQDVRVVSCILLAWVCSMWVLFSATGIFPKRFLNIGPQKDLMFFDSPLNTWPKYMLLVLYAVADQCILALSTNTVEPWLTAETTQIADKKRAVYTQKWIYHIRISYTVFFTLTRIVRIAIGLSQMTFVLLMMVSQVCIQSWLAKRHGKIKSAYIDTQKKTNETTNETTQKATKQGTHFHCVATGYHRTQHESLKPICSCHNHRYHPHWHHHAFNLNMRSAADAFF